MLVMALVDRLNVHFVFIYSRAEWKFIAQLQQLLIRKRAVVRRGTLQFGKTVIVCLIVVLSFGPSPGFLSVPLESFLQPLKAVAGIDL
jgi:hypothetical protein